MYSYGPPHMAEQKQDDQLEHTYNNYLRIRDVALKTCRRRWTIGRSGERGLGISVLAARNDDDDDDFAHAYYLFYVLCSKAKAVTYYLWWKQRHVANYFSRNLETYSALLGIHIRKFQFKYFRVFGCQCEDRFILILLKINLHIMAFG